jgi:CBS domain-containing protein
MTDHVAALCRADFTRLTPDLPMREAITRLVRDNASVAPVLDTGGALVGILSQKDCFRPALHAAYYQQWTGTVADHMTREIVTLDAETDLIAAAECFLSQPFRAYPVTAGGQLVGLLHRSDLLAAFLRSG